MYDQLLLHISVLIAIVSGWIHVRRITARIQDLEISHKLLRQKIYQEESDNG